MNLQEIATNPWTRSLWKASKILGCPIFDRRLAEYNEFDLELMETLNYFDNPENLVKYKRSYADPDFEEYWNEETSEIPEPLETEKKVDISNDDEWEEVEIDE